MKCPKCNTENPDQIKFCGECGAKLLPLCPKCGLENLPRDRYCGGCGQKLEVIIEREKFVSAFKGERKHVTVLFSDISNYTELSENLDPEEVKEITKTIFRETTRIVAKYEGHIDKFIGDAVMILFGIPKTHEDDPIRSIRTALEIHSAVEQMNPHLEKSIGKSLFMHTGINTGLVVTDEMNVDKGTESVLGDTINLASRLTSLARKGEILVGKETYQQSEQYFNFEALEPVHLKGKQSAVQAYKVLSLKEKLLTVHRLSGLRAKHIGREAELKQLEEAVLQLRNGKRAIFSICGEAGIGKSRLIEEFKATLNLKEIQWQEGHAYAYSQNIPYFPLIDFLNRCWHIEESDPPDKVKEKLESNMRRLSENKNEYMSFIGSLYGFKYPEAEGVSPEFWKSRLLQGVQAIFAALIQKAPTIICFEDMHWADPSFIDLLHYILSDFSHPAVFIFVYRPSFNLFNNEQQKNMGDLYQEIHLRDLTPSESQKMIESLMNTQTIPHEIRLFIQEKTEGNPFFTEEVVNSLIESKSLIYDSEGWRLIKSVIELHIPSTINGVIAARIDNLEKEMKKILQEASVIGKIFLFSILNKITELKNDIGRYLDSLEKTDLIRTLAPQPELEYIFRHVLIQEVAYSGLLKKERHLIHERIAFVMEQLFHDRITEFYETLSFHFKMGNSPQKAIDYLVKSAEKSLKRYAVEESHQYFKDAFEILKDKNYEITNKEIEIIKLLLKWAFVFYYRGDFKGLYDILVSHEDMVNSIEDKATLGMFYAWMGHVLTHRAKGSESHQCLLKALRIGEEIGYHRVIGYACAWLTWTCNDLGMLNDAIAFGNRALDISKLEISDNYLYFKSLAGLGLTYHYQGNKKKSSEVSQSLLDFGRKHSDLRSLVCGYYIEGLGHVTDRDFYSAINSFQTALKTSADPFYSQFPKCALGFSYVSIGQFNDAENIAKDFVEYSRNFGFDVLGTPATGIIHLVSIAKGNLNSITELEKLLCSLHKSGTKTLYAICECILGEVYLQIAQRTGPVRFSTIIKNIGFIFKTLPFAARKAEKHFKNVIAVAEEIGAKCTLAQANFNLGMLYKTKNKKDKAKKCIHRAIELFEECGSEIYLKEAYNMMKGLK